MPTTHSTPGPELHHHELRNSISVTGALVGATVGIVGGGVGVAVGGVVGAVAGAISGALLDKRGDAATAHAGGLDAMPGTAPPEERAKLEAVFAELTRELELTPPTTDAKAAAERTPAEEGPEIEPPCHDCLDVRWASAGSVMWCARHTRHHAHGHVHYEYPEPFAMGSLLLRSVA
jgi:hypothetical protein